MAEPNEDIAQAQRIIKGTARRDKEQSQDLLGDISGISVGEESSVSISIPDSPKRETSKRKNTRKSLSGRKKSSVLLQKSLLEREVEAEIERQTAQTAQQREEHFDSAIVSKDRSQLAAVVSLASLQVALLKIVLDAGFKVYTFLYITVTLIGICLLLEIISCFLLIAIYNLRSRMKKLGEIENLYKLQYDTFSSQPDRERGQDYHVDETQPDGKSCWTCCRSGSEAKEVSIEQKLLDTYRKYYIEELEAALQFAEAEAASDKFEDWYWSADSDYNEDTRKFRKSKTIISFTGLMHKWNGLKILRKQGTVITQKARDIHRSKLFEEINTRQNAITYIFYTVMILIIFIVGFCLASAHPHI